MQKSEISKKIAEKFEHPLRKSVLKIQKQYDLKMWQIARLVDSHAGNFSRYLNGAMKMPKHVENKTIQALKQIEAGQI